MPPASGASGGWPLDRKRVSADVWRYLLLALSPYPW